MKAPPFLLLSTYYFLFGASGPPFAGLLDHYGPVAVFLFVLVENCGAPIPGETMLVIAAAYAAGGHLNIIAVALSCIAGVWLGATLSYLAGKRGGVALMARLHVPERHLARAEVYMERWGGYTVLFGRYVAFLRSYIGWLAGLHRMDARRFFVWNLAGATAWTLTFSALGYLVGNNWALVERVLKTIGIGGVVLVAAGIVAFLLYRRRRTARADVQAEESLERAHDPVAGEILEQTHDVSRHDTTLASTLEQP